MTAQPLLPQVWCLYLGISGLFLRFPKWVQIKSSPLKLCVAFKASNWEAGTCRWIPKSKDSLDYTGEVLSLKRFPVELKIHFNPFLSLTTDKKKKKLNPLNHQQQVDSLGKNDGAGT